MIDFTNCPQKKKGYGGANGKKICVKYNGEDYMLKFPTTGKINKDMHYTNGCISEYLGCHIFNAIGIKAQETLLGTYKTERGVKTVVACKDFSSAGIVPQDFASLKNRIIDSERNGYGKELSEILYTIQEQNLFPQDELMNYFWDVFVVDSFIGNWDRHNGNWGFLYNQTDDTLELSPIYDCGSSIYPQADETLMELILKDEKELNLRIYEIPTSSIELNGKRINYFDFMNSLQNDDCSKAVLRIQPRIDMKKIEEIIRNTPGLTALQYDFYLLMLNFRKELIIDEVYNKILYDRPELIE